MDHGFGGAVTVRDTVGPALVVELVLLDTTPFESTPMIVNEYVLAGVTPLGVVVVGVLVAHPGTSISAALRIRSAVSSQAFLVLLLVEGPNPIRPSKGSEHHKPYKARE